VHLQLLHLGVLARQRILSFLQQLLLLGDLSHDARQP